MSPKKNNKRYFNIKEISEYTSLPVKTLYDWAGQGKVPSIKIGRRVLFDLHDIDLIMEKLKRTANRCERTSNVVENISKKIVNGHEKVI